MIAPPQPPRAARASDALDRRVAWIAALAAASSAGAVAVAILAHVSLALASAFIALPGLIALVGFSVLLRGAQHTLFLSRLRVGARAGIVATAAYDVTRFVVETVGWSSAKTFRAIAVFGTGLTGRAPQTGAAIAAGWAFHICNGLGLAIAYTFVASGRPVVFAVAWALALEAAMVTLYPGWLGLSLTQEFLSASIAGHVAFGVALGLIARRAA